MDSEKIAKIACIASILEVSGYPKPGNVHRNRDFHDMSFEDFLISGVVIGDIFKKACDNVKSIETLKEATLGKYILEGVSETDKWIANNTNLGIIMMCMPIACAAAISNNFNELKENIGLLMNNTTVEDAVNLYSAIQIADAGGMGSQDDFDVLSEKAKDELRENNQTMYDVLKISSSWDSLASELTNKMPISFEIGFPVFHKLKDESLKKASSLTFLTILSEVPDTLISRKYGNEKALEISNKVKKLLEFNNDDDFIEKLEEFDEYLYKNKFNPGTTADLTAASIMISYLYSNF